jgi:phosphohistidine phosphatase
MPKTLILVRHSKAEERGLKTADKDRKLTGKGIEDSSRMARFLFTRGINPDLILSSNAARARLTAEIFVKNLNLSEKNLKLSEKLYYSSAKTILDHIYVLNDKINTVLLVGHNPGISDLVKGLTSGRESFMENTQVVIFKYEIEEWHQLDEVNLIDFHSQRVIYTPGG